MTAESDEREANWHQFFGEGLLEELLHKSQPNSSPSYCTNLDGNPHHESMVNKLISTVYSGPTIGDIESALSVTGHTNETERWNISRPIISLPEKGLGKIENKYTIKIKACGNGLTDDGYKWRKYGQKAIKNSPNPRSYYRCTNPRCNAKKQVEKSMEDPDTLIVTYEGLHLHYTYSHFLLSKPNDSQISPINQAKKPKMNSEKPKTQIIEKPVESSSTMAFDSFEQIGVNQEGPFNGLDGAQVEIQNGVFEEESNISNSQGLLEDMVPFLVRKPCNSINNSFSCELYSSDVSSPSDSTVSWASHSSYNFNMSVLSNIM
ncbi:hypothetical protein LUZ60_003804 [Juncus effusus]|nr:hypothetical protein LUZ60_003804 [Juncus effusus]